MTGNKEIHPVLKIVHWLEDGVLLTILMSMILLAVLQIIMRNGFDSSLVWIDPLLRIGVLWIALLGSMIASRNNDHIAIDLVSHYVPDGVQRFITAFIALFAVGICILVAYTSFNFVLDEKEYVTPAVGTINTWVFQTIIPFSFAVIALRYAILCVLALMDRLPPDEPDIEAIEGVE